MRTFQSLDLIPFGLKNNVYFIIQNRDNLSQRSKGKRSNFSDDCGVWNGTAGASPKTYYVINASGELKSMCLRKGVFGYEKNKGKKMFVPLDPQPEQCNVLELCRYYTNLKQDSTYKKRVSWLGLGATSEIDVVEYFGNFPGLSVHGNSKEKTEYTRTPNVVMQEMSDMLKFNKPQHVYNKLSSKFDELSGPTSKRQVYDKNYNDKRTDLKSATGRTTKRQNIADHINELDRLLADETSIVKSIIRDQGKPPCIILYTKEQLDDIKTLCCSGQSLLGVDKTFNLCDMHVTVTCYKQTSVVRHDTSESPIFIGPTFIHDNSDFESYSNFFNHLKTKLADTDTHDLVIGSDEEGGLVNAIMKSFPDSCHVLCTRHLYQNAKQKLVDDSVTKHDRKNMLDSIFGPDGLINADDSICFEDNKTVTSTDGLTTIIAPRTHGKKIGQRKRKIKERTITYGGKKQKT